MIVCSGYFSATETALLSVNRYRLMSVTKNKKITDRINHYIERPDHFLATVLIGNNITNVILVTVVGYLVTTYLGETFLPISSLLLTIIILMFCEVAPKTYAARHPEKFAIYSTLLLPTIGKTLVPISVLVNVCISKIFGTLLEGNKNPHALTTKEIKNVVSESSSFIVSEHRDLILSILDLQQLTVVDVMHPLERLHGINIDITNEKIADRIAETRYSRLPVYKETVDNIIGVVDVRDILRDKTPRIEKKTIYKNIMPPYYVPETCLLYIQFKNFSNCDEHLAIVVNEYGHATGLVTLADITREIATDINSSLHIRQQVKLLGDGSCLAKGFTLVRELNRLLGWDVPQYGPKTIGGLITKLLEDIPDGHVTVDVEGYRFETKEFGQGTIQSVQIWKIGL